MQSHGIKYTGKKTCYTINVGVSSETIPCFSLASAEEEYPLFTSRIEPKNFIRLFLSSPIDSFSDYFKKLIDDIAKPKLYKTRWHRYLLGFVTSGCGLYTPAGEQYRSRFSGWFNFWRAVLGDAI